MAIVNEFKEFATGQYAYVESLQDYETDPERTDGQQSGIARANLNNRALRQGNAMAAAIGGFMAKQGYNARDDGLTDVRRDDFERAILKLIQPSVEVAINAAKINVLQTVFPIGSFYFSYNTSTNPASRLGFGTWQKVEGRFLLGASSGYGAATTGGAATHTFTTDEMPAHKHTGSAQSGGSHAHSAAILQAGSHTHGGTATTAGGHSHGGSIESAGGHSHTRGTMEITGEFRATDNSGSDIFATGAFTAQNVGSGDEGNHGGELKKYTLTASRTWTGNTSSAGAHNHGFSINTAGAHSHSLSLTENGRHAHEITINIGGMHGHTLSIDIAGSSRPVNMMPPYLAIYIWRRTA